MKTRKCLTSALNDGNSISTQVTKRVRSKDKVYKISSLFLAVFLFINITTQAAPLQSVNCYYDNQDYRNKISIPLAQWQISSTKPGGLKLAIGGKTQSIDEPYTLRFGRQRLIGLNTINNISGTITKPRKLGICAITGLWTLKLNKIIDEQEQEWLMTTTEKFMGIDTPVTIKLLCKISNNTVNAPSQQGSQLADGQCLKADLVAEQKVTNPEDKGGIDDAPTEMFANKTQSYKYGEFQCFDRMFDAAIFRWKFEATKDGYVILSNARLVEKPVVENMYNDQKNLIGYIKEIHFKYDENQMGYNAKRDKDAEIIFSWKPNQASSSTDLGVAGWTLQRSGGKTDSNFKGGYCKEFKSTTMASDVFKYEENFSFK